MRSDEMILNFFYYFTMPCKRLLSAVSESSSLAFGQLWGQVSNVKLMTYIQVYIAF